MKQRIHDALLSLVGLAGIAFFALSGASCETPNMQCAVGHGPFAVVYEVTSGDAACYESVYKAYGACAQYDLASDDLPACAGLSKVEHVGFNTYLTVKGRTEVKDDMGKVIAVNSEGADYNTRNIAIQSSTMGGYYRGSVPINAEPPADAGSPYAFGPYSSNPDVNDLCYAGDTAALAVAEINFPDDMIHFRQEWNDVKFYVTAGVPGTQVVGKMKFEDVVAGCSVEYKFTGLYPAVPCGVPVEGYIDADGKPVRGHEDNDMDPSTPAENDTDDDGDPMTPVDNDTDDDDDPMTPVDDDDGKPGPDVDADSLVVVEFDTDDAACDPKADPANGRPTGSGINPDFQTYCHPQYLHCVLKEGTGLIK